jgi:hypothetical protein
MDALLKRIAVALLCGFAVFVIALPVACCGFVVYNEHVMGDVQSNGPHTILSAMVVAALLALFGIGLVMVKTR